MTWAEVRNEQVKGKNKEVVWAHFRFDIKQRIVVYRETPVVQKQASRSLVNFKKYNGAYRFADQNKTLQIE